MIRHLISGGRSNIGKIGESFDFSSATQFGYSLLLPLVRFSGPASSHFPARCVTKSSIFPSEKCSWGNTGDNTGHDGSSSFLKLLSLEKETFLFLASCKERSPAK